jgi:hypothetical protein
MRSSSPGRPPVLALIPVLPLLLAAVSSQAGAARPAHITPLPADSPLLLPPTARAECAVGNLHPGAWAIGDWVWGQEGYKYLFLPTETCSCPVGIRLGNVRLLMQFGPEDVPASFEAYVALEEAVWDDAIGCYVPGEEVCASPVSTVEIAGAGLYSVGISLSEHCGCADIDFPYLLSFHFISTFAAASRPDLIADDFPVGCRSWNDYGFGWQDLVSELSWPGELILWAESSCCELPVATPPPSWGGVKALYR